MKHTIFILMLLMTFASGCTLYQIDSKDTTQDFYAPKKSIDDVTYMEKVDKPFVEIGTVTVTTERRQTLDDVLPKLKQEAAILGGDVITDIQTDAGGIWTKLKGEKMKKLLGNSYIRANFTAKVLVLK